MDLRKLELKDLPFMKLWMKDKSIVSMYRRDFSSMTDSQIIQFIKDSREDTYNRHFAIVSDEDEYMGTVSLKHIENLTAELAIVVRTEALHRGYAWFGIEAIIKEGFSELGLESIYWCVSRENVGAIRFFDKHNFHEVLDVPSSFIERYKEINDLKWYSVLKGDEINLRDTVAGCKVIHIKTIPTINAGELSFFEANRDIPFEIKRLYYISKVPEGVRRGFHAHKTLKQLLFCPYGRIQLVLENKGCREEIELSDPSIGVVISEPTWREMLWIQKDSVLVVAASDYYDPDDYIRDYNEFKEFMSKN